MLNFTFPPLRFLMPFWVFLLVSCFFTPARAGNTSSAWELRIDCSNAYTSPGGNWNTITDTDRNSTTYNLVEFNSGSVTAVYLASSWSGVGTSYGWQNTSVDWVNSNAGHDAFSVDFGSAGFTVGGLTAGGKYEIEIVSSFNTSGSGSTIKIQNNYASRNYNGGASSSELATWDELVAYNNMDWLIWDSVTANDSGSISIAVTIPSGYEWAEVNSIKITAVPEPASISLLACGFLLISRRMLSARDVKPCKTRKA